MQFSRILPESEELIDDVMQKIVSSAKVELKKVSGNKGSRPDYFGSGGLDGKMTGEERRSRIDLAASEKVKKKDERIRRTLDPKTNI